MPKGVYKLTKRPWSEADWARLIELREQGLTRAEIGQALGRTADSVKSQLERLKHHEQPVTRRLDPITELAMSRPWRLPQAPLSGSSPTHGEECHAQD